MFRQAIKHIFAHEPIYYTDGYVTLKYGMPVYPEEEPSKSIENMTQRDIIEDYYTPIWNLSGVTFVPECLRVIYFDCCLLAHESEAIRALQKIAGRPATGKFDIRTANKLKVKCEIDPDKIKREFCAELSPLYTKISKFIDSSSMESTLQTRLFDCYKVKIAA